MNDRESFRRRLFGFIQPLAVGIFSLSNKITATLTNLVPVGTSDRFQHASQYGTNNSPPKGVRAYYLNLFGNNQAPVIIAHLDESRPDVPDVGGYLLYCTPDGTTFPVKVYLKPDGTLSMTATTIQLGAGASNPIPLGNELVTLLQNILTQLSNLTEAYATHAHTFGGPPPLDVVTPASIKTEFDNLNSSPVGDGTLLSNVAFTKRT